MNVKWLREFLQYEGYKDDDEVLIEPVGFFAKEQLTETTLSHRKGVVIITGKKGKCP